MSDQKLRELERRWRETGTVDDEAAYLRERVRVGDLTQERLELAAYCGHEGARRCLTAGRLRGLLELSQEESTYFEGLRKSYGSQAELSMFARRLEKFGTPWVVQALLCVAGIACNHEGRELPADDGLQDAVTLATDWLTSPTDQRSHAAALEAKRLVRLQHANREDAPLSVYAVWGAVWAAGGARPAGGVLSRAATLLAEEMGTALASAKLSCALIRLCLA